MKNTGLDPDAWTDKVPARLEEKIREAVAEAVEDLLADGLDGILAAVTAQYEDQIVNRVNELLDVREEEIWIQIAPKIREKFEATIREAVVERVREEDRFWQ